MSKNFWSLAGVAACLFTGSALAQTSSSSSDWWDGWMNGGTPYVGAKIGGNWMTQDTRLRSNDFASPIVGSAEYTDGYVGALQGGFAWDNGFRLEIEGSDRYNDVMRVRGGYGPGSGSMRNYAAMANVLYELPSGMFGLPDLPVSPYIGVGAGEADYTPYHIRGANFPYPAYIGGPDKWGLAVQGIAGVAYKFTDNIAFTLEYRYFARTDENYPRGVANDYRSESALVGLRYSFGAPPVMAQTAAYVPPPPPPRQAPSTARSSLVFFDFNKSDLTPNARSVVDQAATNAKSNNVTRLEVTGYTDTVGSDAYNMRLSRRRAESVASELEAQGVGSSEIAIFAKGKHDLLVPTGDGVREPQNRRVQIVFSGGPTS
jgi:OOP family OmpA-OmpF porin